MSNYVLLVSGHSDGGDGHGDGGHQRVRRGQRHHVHVVAGVEPRRAGVAHLAAAVSFHHNAFNVNK